MICLPSLSISAESAKEQSELYPRGNIFCFTFYSTSLNDSSYALERGATAIGPFYGNQQSIVNMSKTLNAKCVYKVHPPCMKNINLDKDALPDDETLVKEIKEIVEPLIDNTLIAMWDVVPEELRHWRKKEMHYLELITRTIRELDVEKRPIYMYEPCHRKAEDLKKSVIYQDVCAKGMYVEGCNFRTNRIWARWSMEQELKAIAEAKPSATPWITLWMARDTEEENKGLINNWCRHDAYMGLIMGGKGISIWSGYRNRKGFEHDFQAYFDGYLSVAQDLNGKLNLAPVFLYGENYKNVIMKITEGPSLLKLDYNGNHEYPPVTYTAKVYNKQVYLFMVNSAQEPVTAIFQNLPDKEKKELFTQEISPTLEKIVSVKLNPLEVKAFVFSE